MKRIAMRTTLIFTAAISMNDVEFCTRAEGVSFTGQPSYRSWLSKSAGLAACFIISRFEHATEGIALRFRSDKNTRTIHNPV